MRLNEIDDVDRTWAKTRGINLDIDGSFDEAIEILQMLIRLRSPYRNNIWLPTVIATQHNLREVVNANLANDASTAEIKDKARRMLTEIQNLKKQL